MTQFNSASLNRHIHRTYLGGGINFTDGSVEVSRLKFDWFSQELVTLILPMILELGWICLSD